MNPKFTIKNFKVFDEDGATFELAPVTILTGCNSSGKSSMVKAMMLFSDVMNDIKNDIVNWNKCELPKYKLDFSKLRYNLGKYDLVLNKNAEKNAKISFEYTMESQVLVEDISVKLSFVSSDGDEMNYGWLSDLEISKSDGTCIFAAEIVDGKIRIKSINAKCIRRNFINYIKMECGDRACWCLDETQNADEIIECVNNDSSISKHEKTVLYNFIKNNRNKIGNDFLKFTWDLACRLSKGEPYSQMPIFTDIEKNGFTNEKAKTIDFLNERCQSLQSICNQMIFKTSYDRFIEAYKNSNYTSLVDFFRSCKEEKFTYLEQDDYRCRTDLFEGIDGFCNFYCGEYGCPIDMKDCEVPDNSKVFYNNDGTVIDGEMREDLIGCNESAYIQWCIECDKCTNWHVSQFAKSLLAMLSYGGEWNSLENHILSDLSYECLFRFIKSLVSDVFTQIICNDYVSSSRAVVQRLYSVGDKSNEFGTLIQRYLDAKKNCRKDYTPDTFLNKWIRNFNIGNSIVFKSTEEGLGILAYLYKGVDDCERHLLADEGYGVTQLASLLLQIETSIIETKNYKTYNTSSLVKMPHVDTDVEYKYKPTLIAVEEPEIHLHPHYQSLLADMFYDAYKDYNIRFIVETHSEYLIRRSQVIVSEMKFSTNQEAEEKSPFITYYVPKDAKPYSLGYRKDGKFKENFGSGFYDEASDLAFKLL